jgi:hypothetical protein
MTNCGKFTSCTPVFFISLLNTEDSSQLKKLIKKRFSNYRITLNRYPFVLFLHLHTDCMFRFHLAIAENNRFPHNKDIALLAFLYMNVSLNSPLGRTLLRKYYQNLYKIKTSLNNLTCLCKREH